MFTILIRVVDWSWFDLTFHRIVDDVTPQKTEDNGTGGKKMEDGDLDFANSEWKAENIEAAQSFKRSKISNNLMFLTLGCGT